MTLTDCKAKLKDLLIDSLHLEGLKASDIKDDLPLFDPNGLNLDSLDAVELVVAIEKEFGLAIKNADEAKELFASVDVLAKAILDKSLQREPMKFKL